jgi:hypothetical protein
MKLQGLHMGRRAGRAMDMRARLLLMLLLLLLLLPRSPPPPLPRSPSRKNSSA